MGFGPWSICTVARPWRGDADRCPAGPGLSSTAETGDVDPWPAGPDLSSPSCGAATAGQGVLTPSSARLGNDDRWAA
eukprot:3751827-Pyramimonas_sp.AAC.1